MGEVLPVADEEIANDSEGVSRILVLSPWGLSGGYSGPLVLLNRLFAAVVGLSGASVDVLYRDRGRTAKADWVANAHPLVKTDEFTFGIAQRLKWILRTRWYLMRHGHEYDVIHIHGAYAVNTLPFIGLACRRRLAVFPVLDGGDLTTGHSEVLLKIKDSLLGHVVGRAHCGLALAPGIAQDLVNLGLPAGRVFNIPNAVDVEEFSPDGRSLKSSPATFTLGFVGKMSEIKQPHLLLEALSKLRSVGLDVEGLFVGPFASEGYKDRFISDAAKYDLTNRIRLMGYQENVAPYFREMDLFVLPSTAEGMPGALVEAMSSGVPAIVSDVGSMRDVVEASRGGYVVAPSGEDIAEVAKSICDDQELRLRVGQSARNFAVQNFSSDAVARHYLLATNISLPTATT